MTVMHGKSTAVLEMDYPIVDFLTLCETPYPNGEAAVGAGDSDSSELCGCRPVVGPSVRPTHKRLPGF